MAPPVPNESRKKNGGSPGQSSKPDTVHPTAAAAQAAAGAASSAAMAGVMLALKALKTTAENSGGAEQSPRRRQGEFQNGGGKKVAGESEGGHTAGVKRHRKKRNGAGQGVRLDVPMGGLEGPMVSLQGGPPGRIQSSSKALAGLPKGGLPDKSKRGAAPQGGESGASRKEALGFGGQDQAERGAHESATQRSGARDGLSGHGGTLNDKAAALSPKTVESPPTGAEASSGRTSDKNGDAESAQRGGQDADGVQIEDPPGVGEGYLGSSGSAVEGLSERSTSDSSLAEARGGSWAPGKKHADEVKLMFVGN